MTTLNKEDNTETSVNTAVQRRDRSVVVVDNADQNPIKEALTKKGKVTIPQLLVKAFSTPISHHKAKKVRYIELSQNNSFPQVMLLLMMIQQQNDDQMGHK